MMEHVNWLHYIGLFAIPNGIWVLLPLYFMLTYGKILQAGLKSLGSGKTKSE